MKTEKLKSSAKLIIKKSLSFIEDIKALNLQENLEQYRVCKTKNAENIKWEYYGHSNKDIDKIIQAANQKGTVGYDS